MPENTDFINMYIKRLVEEVTELTKTKVLLTTKEDFSKAQIEELNEKLEELEESIAKEKDDAAQVWKTALEEKDEDTRKESAKLQHELADFRRQLDQRHDENKRLAGEKQQLADKNQVLTTKLGEAEGAIGKLKVQLEKTNSREAPTKAAPKKREKKGEYIFPSLK